MFRLAEMDEESELYKYLAPIASKTVLQGLIDWCPDDDGIVSLYMTSFAKVPETPEEQGRPDFFEGIGRYNGIDNYNSRISFFICSR